MNDSIPIEARWKLRVVNNAVMLGFLCDDAHEAERLLTLLSKHMASGHLHLFFRQTPHGVPDQSMIEQTPRWISWDKS